MSLAPGLRRARSWVGVLLLVAVGGLVTILLWPRPEPPPPPANDELLPEPEGEESAQVSTRFDFTRTRTGLTDLRVRSDRVLGIDGTTYRLDAPILEVHHEDGEVTEIRGARGAFDTAAEEGRIEGGAQAVSSAGLAVEAEALLSRAGGTVLEAEGLAHFRRDGVRGQGRGLRYDPSTDRLTLDRDVEIEGGDGDSAWLLRTSALEYFTTDGSMRTGPFGLDGAHGNLKGKRLELSLDPETTQPQRLIAAGAATLQEETADGGDAGRLEGERIEMEPSSTGEGVPRRVEAIGDARLQPGPGRGGDVQELRARRIEITRDDADPDGPRQLQAEETVRLLLNDAGGPARLESDRLEATLGAGGRLEQGIARGEVRLRGARGDADAETARFEAAGARLRLTGPAEAPPRLITPGREVIAHSLLLEQDAGILHADGDVRTVSSGSPSEEGLFESGEPIYGTADSLRAYRDDDRAVYQGGARLWQGDNLLQADRVEARRAEGLLEAEGRVLTRTLTRSDAGEPRQVQGTSGRLEYREAEQLLVYDGDAELHLGDDQVSASRIDVHLGADRQVERVVAEGNVRASFQGTRGEGDHLDYHPARGQAVLRGDGRLAIAEDTENQRVVRGGTLTFQLADGRIQVESAPGGRNWINLGPGAGEPTTDERGQVPGH